MQLSNAPSKIKLPFANNGTKNTIPVASQIGITAGAASYTDGFPPLTFTPVASGGVPPYGADFNGILNASTAIDRWFAAGAGFVYDSAFATDSNVGGYPKGARVLRSDGLGYWLNISDNNTTNPESGGSNWVPDYTYGIAEVTMTGSNVTLTALQYGQPIINITGTLTANVQLLFPDGIAGQWSVINSTSGAFTVTAKTVSGTGVTLSKVSPNIIVSNSINILSASQTEYSAIITTNGSAAYDIAGIPAGIKRLRLWFNGVSTNGSSTVVIRLGSGTIDSSGYSSVCFTNANVPLQTSGFVLTPFVDQTDSRSGQFQLERISGNSFVATGLFTQGQATGAFNASLVGTKTLSGDIDSIRITTSNGTDLFDSGNVKIEWEM